MKIKHLIYSITFGIVFGLTLGVLVYSVPASATGLVTYKIQSEDFSDYLCHHEEAKDCACEECESDSESCDSCSKCSGEKEVEQGDQSESAASCSASLTACSIDS